MSFNKYPTNYRGNGYGWHRENPATPPWPENFGFPGRNRPIFMPMPELPNNAAFVPNIVGYQMSYGFEPIVRPTQIPNAPRPGSTAPKVDQQCTIGWRMNEEDDTSVGISHDPHMSETDIVCHSVSVPLEDRMIYSNQQFFQVSTLFSDHPPIVLILLIKRKRHIVQ